MSTLNKISTIEAIALVIIPSINRLILFLPQNILVQNGSSSILNVLYISIIAIIFTYIICILFKNFSGLDIIDISEFLGGKVLRTIIGIFICVYIMIMSAILVREFCEVLHILYYQNASVIYLLLSFFVVTIVANMVNGNSLIRTNFIFCFGMVASLILCFGLVIPNMTYQRFFPILGNGINTIFISGLMHLFSLNGLMVLYLIPPMLKNTENKNFKKIALISVIITTLLLISATVCLLLSFSFVTELKNISPVYLLISNNPFGKYFQHPESLFMFVWILSFMTYLNIAVMFELRILKKLSGVKNSKPFIFPLCMITFILALLPPTLIFTREINIISSKYIAGPFVFVIFPIILLLANLKKRRFS